MVRTINIHSFTLYLRKTMNEKILPKLLWYYFIKAIANHLALEYSVIPPKDTQVWTIIPNKQRIWIDINQLNNSTFALKKELIGLDFDKEEPIIASGKYWINLINDSISKKGTLACRNIYVFDSKMKLLLFYLEGSENILVNGKQKHLALK